MQRETLLGGVGLTLAVVAGAVLGRTQGHPGDPPHVFTNLGLFALILLAAGAISGAGFDSPRSSRLTGRGASIAAAVYCAAVMVAEPFFLPCEAIGAAVAAAWAAPLAAAGMVLARVRCWWGFAGAFVFLLACAWLVTLNMQSLDQSGFITRVRY